MHLTETQRACGVTENDVYAHALDAYVLYGKAFTPDHWSPALSSAVARYLLGHDDYEFLGRSGHFHKHYVWG